MRHLRKYQHVYGVSVNRTGSIALTQKLFHIRYGHYINIDGGPSHMFDFKHLGKNHIVICPTEFYVCYLSDYKFVRSAVELFEFMRDVKKKPRVVCTLKTYTLIKK